MIGPMRYRVYWEDTDAGGVVYHARYLHFLERARSDWLLALGFPQRRLKASDNCLFAVSRVDIRFLMPARLEDELDVAIDVEQLRAASVMFTQSISRADGELLATADVRGVCLRADDFRPARIPDALYQAIAKLERQQDQ